MGRPKQSFDWLGRQSQLAGAFLQALLRRRVGSAALWRCRSHSLNSVAERTDAGYLDIDDIAIH